MITKFKLFESISIKPLAGDYAIVVLAKSVEEQFDAVGKIKQIDVDKAFPYVIEFENSGIYNQPDGKYVDVYNLEELKCWSNSKDELDQLLITKKFNI